ncbi:hypothetical protein X290_05405 [Oenococcus oeni IOEB_B16]|nr:hypothetical protein [Oenococcus oeni]KGH66851.1 hypothetical protein X290_05405 [Oenococcus oeni IOEB_B16]
MLEVTLIKSGDDFYKLSGADVALFNEYSNVDELIEYDPSTLLEENMAYKISNFSKKEYDGIDILKNTFNATDYNEYSNDLIKDFLLNIVDNIYYFQRITPSMLRPKRLLRISDKLSKPSASFEKIDQGETISLQAEPDAIYYKDKDELCFKNLNAINRFFMGIDSLYREATDDEIKVFLNQNFIKAKEGFFLNKSRLITGKNCSIKR